ncbi:MAG: hypothetical protein K5829_01065 [Treponema sp.]|nr:hypothetical protein [Treponema sp.]
MNLVTIENGELRLNSLMNEQSFGKTNYDSIVTEKGLLAKGKLNLNSQIFTELDFSDWTFSDIQALDVDYQNERCVFYCGKVPFFSSEAKSLFDFYRDGQNEDSSENQKAELFNAAFLIIALLTQAAQTDITIPLNGAGGTILQIEEHSGNLDFSILFLPPDLYKYSATTLPKEECAQIYGFWKNETLYELPALCFMRAILAYKLLVNKFPFEKIDITERNSDILDKKFLPIDYAIKNINDELAGKINKALKLTSSAVNIPGKKQKGKASEDLTPEKDFPLTLLYAEKTHFMEGIIIDKDFSERAENFTKAQDSRIAAKRKIRRNSTTILISAIFVLIVAIITANTIKGRMGEYTSIGLTSEQTIEAYFKATNRLDVMTIDNLIKGKSPKGKLDTLSQIYVVSKQRKAYNRDNGIASPENWLLYVTDYELDKSSGLYGASNVFIDGKLSNLDVKLPVIKDKPLPLKEEKGISLKDGEKSIHSVEYYLLHTEGENNEIYIEYIQSTFTLTFTKNRWLITQIDNSSEEIELNSRLFKNEYFNMLRQNDKDVLKVVQMLSIRYPWLPSQKVLQAEKDRMEYNALHPFENL